MDGGWRRVAQYTSTLAFMLAWNYLRFGIWKDPGDEPRWITTATKDSVKAIGILVVVALCGGGLGALAKVQDEPAAAGSVHSGPVETTEVGEASGWVTNWVTIEAHNSGHRWTTEESSSSSATL
jgi:hypothetical protein